MCVLQCRLKVFDHLPTYMVYSEVATKKLLGHGALETGSDKVFRTPMVSIYVLILVPSGIRVCLQKIQIRVLLFQRAISLELDGRDG